MRYFQSASMNLMRMPLMMTTTEPRASPSTCRNTARMFSCAPLTTSHTHRPTQPPIPPGTLNCTSIALTFTLVKKGQGRPYSITERGVPELIPVLGSQPAGDVSHIPGGRLPLLSARPAVTPATLKRAATNFAACRTEARWV